MGAYEDANSKVSYDTGQLHGVRTRGEGTSREDDELGWYNDDTVMTGTSWETPVGVFQGMKHMPSDLRGYQYGRSATGADEAVARAYGGGDAAAGFGGVASSTAYGLMPQYMNRAAARGDWSAQDASLAGAEGYAGELARLEATEGPSAAQAMLQSGTNQALNSQLALARSGRGFGGGAAASSVAAGNMASAQANQANSAAALRAQETADQRRRAAANLGAAAGINTAVAGQQGQQSAADLSAYYQNQGQNDQQALGLFGAGNDAYFKGAALGLQGQGLANDIRGRELDAGIALDDRRLRAWAAENGYALEEQKQEDQKEAGYISASAAAGAALLSDVRQKTNVVPADGAGSEYARSKPFDPFERDWGFDGEIYRPREMTPMQQRAFGGNDGQLSPEEVETFRAMVGQTEPNERSPGDTARVGQTDVPRNAPFDRDALDVANLDAVRNAPASFYDYKDPSAVGASPGRKYGPMAQDLLKTPAGASAVVEQPGGKLGVDTGRLALVNTGAIGEQQQQLDNLQAQLDELLGKQERDQGDTSASYYGGSAR